jgi:hypothetical protein
MDTEVSNAGAEARICLIVVFNHRFEANLSLLDRLYRGRFGHVRYLMPFYCGTRNDVIPVYECSYQFQGYFAQGYDRFYEPQFTHYVFVADDLLLNPMINEGNILNFLELDANSAYIKSIHALADIPVTWSNHRGVNHAFSRRGTEYAPELPAPEDVLQKSHQFGITYVHDRLGLHSLQNSDGSWLPLSKILGDRNVLRMLPGVILRKRLPYPLLMGYSDFLVVPASVLTEFCHLCGVTAAMGLFVEIAIPTILTYVSPILVTETRRHIASAPVERTNALTGLELWFREEVDALALQHGQSLSMLLKEFPEHQLYIHPIKLSKWHT